MMRSVVWLVCLLAAPLALVACGEPEQPPGAKTPPKATATTAAPATVDDEWEYELDVIAEAEPDEGPPPLAVRFTADIEEDEGGPWKFHWDFGDGTTSSEQNPGHTYTKVDDYTALLTVTDSRGYEGTDEIDVFVETEEDWE